jgi:hypothetical protein
MKNTHAYILATVLAVIGTAIFVYKWAGLGLPLTPDQSTETWQIESRISFRGRMGPIKVTLPTPVESGQYAVIDQIFVARDYGLSTQLEGVNRRTVFATRDAHGDQILYARFTVHKVPRGHDVSSNREKVEEPQSSLSGARRLAAQAVLDAAKAKSADVSTLTLAILERFRHAGIDDSVDTLLARRSDPLEIARAAVEVMHLAGHPARVVSGVRLVPQARNVNFVHWIEVHIDGAWQPFSLKSSAPGIPEEYFPWWRGGAAFIQSSMSGDVTATTTVARAPETAEWSALVPANFAERSVLDFSLLTLPLDTQQVYRLILMVPLGVLILVLLRNVVGITTFGTFMPVLIALSFRETTLIWGIVLFVVVVGAGLLVRVYLEYLKLLIVPRLACVLISVILLMMLLSLLTNKLGIDRGLSVALFPLVIITMTIERMSIIWDENGPGAAFKQGLGSLAVAAVCYFAMSIAYVEHLLFFYPEILLVLLAFTVLLGRYSGYRLTELWRFRELAKAPG